MMADRVVTHTDEADGSLRKEAWVTGSRASRWTCCPYLSHHQRAVLGVVAVSVIAMRVLQVARATKGFITSRAD